MSECYTDFFLYIGLEIPNKRNLAELTYMEKVLKESLRAKPVGPVILRRAISDDVMDNHSIPEGTNIILHLAQMHRDPRNFTSPNGFNPEHFNKVNSCTGILTLTEHPIVCGRICSSSMFRSVRDLRDALANTWPC